jgi:anti-sigma28 factor (negative regulator of flagellin synthesis)
MKISDNGFSERISTPSTRTQSSGEVSQGSSSSSAYRSGSSTDTLQLSSFASRLQNSSSVDSSRASRIAQITKAVQSNSFQVDPMQISRAMVSEAVGSKAG